MANNLMIACSNISLMNDLGLAEFQDTDVLTIIEVNRYIFIDNKKRQGLACLFILIIEYYWVIIVLIALTLVVMLERVESDNTKLDWLFLICSSIFKATNNS